MEDKSRIWGISDVKAFLISIITGFILLTIVAVIFTEISNETVNKTADRWGWLSQGFLIGKQLFQDL